MIALQVVFERYFLGHQKQLYHVDMQKDQIIKWHYVITSHFANIT